MYAIVETGGKQYRVKPGDTVAVERLSGEPGETLDLDRVLLVAGHGDAARIGSPGIEGAVVRAEVVEQFRGEKIIVFRYKSKVRYRRKTGHRQSLTRLRITDIVLDGISNVAVAEPEVIEPTPIEPTDVVAVDTVEPTAADVIESSPRASAVTAPAAEQAATPGVTGSEDEPATVERHSTVSQGERDPGLPGGEN